MVLMAPTAEALQILIDACQAYAATHDIIYNTTKTECMVIPPKNSKVTYVKSALLNGCALKFVNSFTYLGHIITEDIRDDCDILKQNRKLTAIGNTILRKFSFCTQEVKLELFRSYCYSIYCNSLWYEYRAATIQKIRVCHNDILKRMLRVPRWSSSSRAFVTNNVKCLDVLRRNSIYSLKCRVNQSTNSIITAVRQSSAYVNGTMYQEWMTILHRNIAIA